MAITEVLTWDLAAPTQIHIEEHDSFIREQHDYGANLIVPIGGVAWKVWGGPRSFYLYHSCPGTTPMYFMQVDRAIHFSQSWLAIRAQAKTLGVKVKDIVQAKEGVAYHYSSKGLRRYVVDTIKYEYHPEVTLAQAGTKLLEMLVAAAKFYEGKKVCTLLSGGTDGLLTALALKLAGIEQKCVCVGVSEDDFDPQYARKYADQLDLDYTFLPLPADHADMTALLERALTCIEMTDFSNVLMGICSTLIAGWAKEQGCTDVATADIADVILGQDLLSWGSFNKHHPNGNSPAWGEFRLKGGMRTLPNNLMVYKVFNFSGLRTGQLFLSRDVVEFLLGLSLEVTPANGKKPVYYEALKPYITGGSWEGSGRKWGYYSGSGIGKIRLKDPVLQDENIRRVYKEVAGEAY